MIYGLIYVNYYFAAVYFKDSKARKIPTRVVFQVTKVGIKS